MRGVLVLVLVLFSVSALAREIEVPMGGRAPLRPGKVVHEINVRDPSLLTVVVTDGEVSLEGKKSGTTGVTVSYANGDYEHVLVVIGPGSNSKGPRMERTASHDLKKPTEAQAKAVKVENKSKEEAAVNEAYDALRAAVKSL